MAGKEEECLVAKEFSVKATPVRGFGSSDCKCMAHLFKLNNLDFFRDVSKNFESYIL